MENNRINLFNDLKKTNIVGGKLPREICEELQMIGGQASIRVHSKGNLAMMSVNIIYYISCQLSHSRSYQLQGRLYIRYTNSNTLNRPFSYSTHCMFQKQSRLRRHNAGKTYRTGSTTCGVQGKLTYWQ